MSTQNTTIINTNECTICKQIFSSRNQLFKHIKYNHEINNLVGKRKIGCTDSDVCDESDNEDENITEINNAKRLEIKTVQEDGDWYRIILKPQGLPTMGEKAETLRNSDQMFIEGRITYKKAVPCHRLDKATGGLVLCSKSKLAHSSITQSFEKREIFKRYRAIVMGRLEPPQGIIDFPVSGQRAETKYEVVCYTKSHQYEWITTVDLWPLTGRRHQLRKHLKELGHSIIGDPKYCVASDWCTTPPFQNMMFLWALELKFPHKGQLKDLSIASTEINNDIYNDNKTFHGYPVISVSIEEPTCYEEFRCFQLKSTI